MIRVDIYAGSGIISFEDEIESFTWSVKNPEGLPFQVSLPVVSANIVLHTISADLSNVKRGDRAHVVNPEGEVKLVMNVILVTILEDKGITEIAFEGLPVEGNKLGNGVFNTTQNYLNDFVYSGSVRLSPTTQFTRGNAVISKKQDYLLSHIWGGNKLLNIAPTEYTGADKDFKLVEFDNAEEYVPVYDVTPDNLISFEVSPAQPPVTGLRNAQRVENEPTPVLSVADGARVAKGFFIEGDVKAQAVYTLRLNKGGSIATQQLAWADGHVLDLGDTRVSVAGIFTDSYVEVEPLPSEIRVEDMSSYYIGIRNVEGVDYHAWQTRFSGPIYLTASRSPVYRERAWVLQYDENIDDWTMSPSGYVITVIYGSDAYLKRKDKYTKDDIGDPVILNNVDYYFEVPANYSRMLVEPTITTVVAGRETMWFNTVRNEGLGSLKVGLTKNMTILNADIGWWNDVVPSEVWYDFVSAYCGNDFASIILVQPLQASESRLRYIRIRQTGDANVVIDIAGDLAVPGLPSNYELAEAYDAFDNHMRGSGNSLCVLFNTSRYDGVYGYKTIAINVGETGIDYMDVIDGGFQFLDSGDKSVVNYVEAPIIQMELNAYTYRQLSSPLLILSNLIDRDVINELNAVDFLEWFNYGSRYTRYRSNCINVFYVDDLAVENEEVYRVVMFDEPVPWAQKRLGELSRIHELGSGAENIVDLPFIVRDLSELRVPVKERGRIILDLASFDYTIDGDTKTAIVQNLELPALMSLVRVRTSFESNLRIMQVIGADIDYRGVTRLRLQGIIKYEIVPQALTQLSEVLVGVEYWFKQPLDFVNEAIGSLDTPGNYIMFRRRRLGNYAVIEETLIGKMVLNKASQNMTAYSHISGTTYVEHKVISFADYNAGDEIWTFEIVRDTAIGHSGLEEFLTTIGGHIK